MLEEIASTPIGEIPIREPVRVTANTLLGEVVTRMREMRRGSALIEEGGEVRGIFTERDLMQRVNHGDQSWRNTPVGDVMTKGVVTIDARMSVSEAVQKMKAGLFRRMPVDFGAGKPVGMVSIRDILAYIAEHFPAEFLNLPPDPEHEATAPWGG